MVHTIFNIVQVVDKHRQNFTYPPEVRRKAQPSRAVVVYVALRAVHEQNNCESAATNVVQAHTKGLCARFLSLGICFFIVKL